MAVNKDSSIAENGHKNWKKTLLFSLIILLAGGVVTVLIFLTEPTADRETATRETAMLVEVTGVERGNFNPTIVATGTVVPEQEITLRPRVSGEIIQRSPAFTPGSFVKKGEVLLQIDPADYKNSLRLRESELLQATADLEMEMGRQFVAQKDYELLGDSLPGENKALVLREPQLNAEKSRVDAARADVEQAELELQRTTIRAPFDAHILNRNANVGSQVAPGENLGRLVGVNTYWVEVTVPPSALRWLTFPEDENEKGSEVRIRNRTAWPEGQYRQGYLFRLVGTLEDQTRLARVLVAVPDPLGYQADSPDLPVLMIGSYVEVGIRGKELTDVIRIDRDYIRKDETVWVMEDERLSIREIDIEFRDEDFAYVVNGLKEEDQVVTTNLATVAEGARLRVEAAGTASGSNQSETQSSGGTR